MANVYWRMTKETYNRYLDIYDELLAAAKSENTLAYEFAKDQLRSLPGFPHGIHPDMDRVIPLVDNAITHIVTVGRTPPPRSLD